MSTSPSSDCSGTYTTPKGLEFSLLCNEDTTNRWDIDSTGTATVQECLDRCSVHTNTLCGAAGFDPEESRCYFKTKDATASDTNSRDNWIFGVADQTQIQPLSSECTGNRENVTSQNGLAFTVYCDQTVAAFDLCPNDSPECRTHTNSLEECLDYCSTMHPLCTSVDWDARLRFGWLNCYPKNGTAREFEDTRKRSDDGLRTAKAVLETVADDCPSQADNSVTASNGDVFDLLCGEDRPNNNITVQHAASLDTCVNLCATEDTENCFGVVFDATMAGGYENCYLKSAAGVSVQGQGGFTVALRQNAVNNPTPNSPPSNSTLEPPERSKARIAGPTIGAIAAFAIIVVAILLWQARRRRRARMREKEQGSEDIAMIENIPKFNVGTAVGSHGLHSQRSLA